MADDLIRRIHAAREEWIDVGRFKFCVRRMADLPLARTRAATRGDNAAFVEAVVRGSIVDWQGVDEATLAPGGNDQPVPFSSELFMTWVEDQPDVWSGIVDAVLGVMARHRERIGAVGKN